MDRAILAYYAAPGPLTDLTRHAAALAGLPTDIDALVATVQKVLRPNGDAPAHRSADQLLTRALALDPRPLTAPRPADRRISANRRDIAVLLCALLRHLGAPSRARCGYVATIEAGQYVAHWICEVWHPVARRWVMVDAQPPPGAARDVDPLNLPPGVFWPAGRAWLTVRGGEADFDDFTDPEMSAGQAIHDNVVLDVLALNKVEGAPDDTRGVLARPPEALTAKDLHWLDALATLSAANYAAFDRLRARFETDPRLATIRAWAAAQGESPSHA
jgi:hypothetical protein